MPYIISQLVLLFLVLFLNPAARAQQTLFPGAVPLAVRSPYLNCWEPLRNSSTFGRSWPMIYDISQTFGWTLLARIDGLTYSLFGGEVNAVNGTANLTSIAITPTRTLVVAQAGHMELNLTFLSPIERGESNWVKQSIPFSYLSFTAKSLDGLAHTVQVYSDVSGEWNSGDRGHLIKWSATNNTNIIYHSVKLQAPAKFSEIGNQAEWGTLYYAMAKGNDVTFKVTVAIYSRLFFAANGTLDDQVETNFRGINDSYPIFAIARDLGSIQATQAPVVWTIGFITDPAISYADLSGAPPTERSLYYKSQYTDDASLIVDFVNNFDSASSTAQQLDQKILQEAASVDNLLGDLVSLALAQVYGSMQLTIGTDAHGNFDKSDVMMFMKNIGGVNTHRVNAVETLYAAFPALMYIDPSLGAPLLEPLFRLQASPNYTMPFAAADLGSSYPNVTGTNSNHDQEVEQTGNMLIMTYAQARASGDGSLISRYYSVLSRWADYLTNATLFIHDQSSADKFSISNQTNLAIKGIIAIEAMSKMSSVVKQSADSERYSNVAAQLYGQWKSLALNNGHILSAYGQANSWTLGYNLFADVWLGTGLVEASVYNNHSSFIDNMAALGNFGIPTESIDTSTVVSSWNLFVAAMTQDQNLRSRLISDVHNRASLNTTADVFPIMYDTTHGGTLQGAASPAQGAMLAPLALKAPVLSIKANGVDRGRSGSSRASTGTILAAVTGVVAATLIGLAVFVLVRRRRRREKHKSLGSFDLTHGNSSEVITPFEPIPLAQAYSHDSSATWMEQQQLLFHPSEAGIIPVPYDISSAPTPVPPRSNLQPVAPVTGGLSSKELAFLRAEGRNAQQTSPNSLSNRPQPASPSGIIFEQGRATSTSEAWRLQSEVESLRREMQQLQVRTERFEAPPSYTEGDA